MAPLRGEPSVRSGAREALLVWFRAHAPEDPWRRTAHDPYTVLVSEIMLQQTQASRVADVFPVFLRRFPDVRWLAESSRADVVRAWTGLGYNRRAVALHEAARVIVRDNGGEVPADLPSLLSLPGVGPYTAGAVASIAFGVATPAIDTNVGKVMARLAFGAEPDEVPSSSIVEAAGVWLALETPGDWNQAVMNLGREICRPTPRCHACPLAPACRFKASGRSGRRSGRTQPVFAGSMRQVRGGIVRELSARGRSTPTHAVAGALGVPPVRVDAAADALAREGLIERTPSGRLRLSR